jgi:hypothetical protein
MKVIEACMKLYNDKNHHTNSNTNSQSGDVNDGVIPVTVQTSEGSFKIVSEHKQVELNGKQPKEYRFGYF